MPSQIENEPLESKSRRLYLPRNGPLIGTDLQDHAAPQSQDTGCRSEDAAMMTRPVLALSEQGRCRFKFPDVHHQLVELVPTDVGRIGDN